MKYIYAYAEGAGLMRIPIHECEEFFSGYWAPLSNRVIYHRYCDVPEELR